MVSSILYGRGDGDTVSRDERLQSSISLVAGVEIPGTSMERFSISFPSSPITTGEEGHGDEDGGRASHVDHANNALKQECGLYVVSCLNIFITFSPSKDRPLYGRYRA